MIFLTLGTQLPFDRLVEAVDNAVDGLDEEIFGQIGKSGYKPKNMQVTDYMTPREFNDRFAAARVIVAHAGIGSILSGFNAGKPLVIMARRAELGEHRNDHQLATVAQMQRIPGIHVAETTEDLRRYFADPDLLAMSAGETPERTRLIGNLRKEIFG
ncbi:glycosyltransferase [Pseudooceanicola algae]|uniref:Glycosyl transferase family 28 C-terminal domain-containing protein n=1 Tax=Pseudooceanicola algae TaxID=1537215 RepID=A0A418SDA6_9RHOB|nr:glycosyltransferase [Pseudooceanicola algae]QPM92553.1 hypothetical protein PSAL_038170 [Pseudooceanicola algae]